MSFSTWNLGMQSEDFSAEDNSFEEYSFEDYGMFICFSSVALLVVSYL